MAKTIAAIVIALLLAAYGPLLRLSAQGAPLSSADPDADACRRNLQLIFDAIQRYRSRNHQLPNRLSDLFPAYLGNQAYLVCPAAKRRGLTSPGALLRTDFSDPLTSYFYEFTPVDMPEFPGQTQRSWKQRQMGLLGGAVPMVRCVGVHERAINLSFGGEVYESGLYWEDNFTNLVSSLDLTPSALFREAISFRVVQIPPRPEPATEAQIDLADFYNGSLAKPWNSAEQNNGLGALKAGLHEFGGVTFDVRGLVQLRGDNGDVLEFPKSVHGIVIRQKCRRVHFLQSTTHPAPAGTEVARYRFHFANQQTLEVPILYGSDLVDWWEDVHPGVEPWASHLAWTGDNESARRQGKSVHLYQTTWENPWPDTAITSLDFVSALSPSGPFLLGVTTER